MLGNRTASDVTAVVLSTGEPTTSLALECVRRQAAQVADIIVVEDVYPFHKALNHGASLVSTPYFVQVDADMLLDPDCIGALRQAMHDDVGVAVGQLRDAMIGRVVGVKLFRKACFDVATFPDSISPDTDFLESISLAGWRTVFVGRQREGRGGGPRTFGEHRPDYQPDYVFRKALMEGQRYHHRAALGGLRWHFNQLQQSVHPQALLARIALAAGVFETVPGDALGRTDRGALFARVWADLESSRPALAADVSLEENGTLGDRFRSAWEYGRAAAARRDGRSLRATLDTLDGLPDDYVSLTLKLGLCRGFFAEGDALRDFQQLERLYRQTDLQLTTDSEGSHDLTLDEVFDYAAEVGLTRFATGPSIGGQFRRTSGVFERTKNTVASRADAAGRPRIDAPFQPFGTFVCTDPSRPEGLFWCFDLLRKGYTRLHVPGPFGAYGESLPRRALRGLAERLRGRLPSQPQTPTPAALRRMLKPPSSRPYAATDRRVLMVIESLLRGGAERQLLAVTAGLQRRGYDVSVLSFADYDPGLPAYVEDLRGLGIEVCHGLSRTPANRLRMCRTLGSIDPADAAHLPRWLRDRIVALSHLLGTKTPQVVHAWGDGPGIAALLAAGALGAGHVVVQQGSMAIYRQRHAASALIRNVYVALADRPNATIINNSLAGAIDNERWIGLPRGTIRVRYNGLLPASVRSVDAAEIAQFKVNLGWRADTVVVGTITRIVEVKDPDLWLATAMRILRQRPDVRFLFGGYGPLYEETMATAERIGLGGSIRFVGAVEDVGLVYSAMDVVLLTSRIEGVPNVMIEAQAVGRPVVAPDVGGTSEALDEGVTGLIARPRDDEHLAAAVLRLIDEPAWRARVRQEGPRFVAERFDADRMVEATIETYGTGRRRSN